MAPKFEPPNVEKVSFNCPRCGANAHQKWYRVRAEDLGNNAKPSLWDQESYENLLNEQQDRAEEAKVPDELLDFIQKSAAQDVAFAPKGEYVGSRLVSNLHLSQCYSCSQLTLWLHSRILWPIQIEGPPPNADLPSDILADYQEAGAILPQSPRGAAALLRLAIQKLCRHLKQPGENLNSDIASLVKQGLDSKVQKALDIVRVIGNEAVHPGQIDLKDDTSTALELFGLVNVIAEVMISQPAHIEKLYAALPEAKRQAIEKRDRD